MATLFRTSVNQYRSSDYETKRNLFKSRNVQRERARRLRKKLEILEGQKKQLAQELAEAELQIRAHRLAAELHMLGGQEPETPTNPLLSDLPISGHQYAAKMILLCIELGTRIGFRRAETAIQAVFDSMNIPLKVPSYETIRQWASRVGVAQLEDTFHKDQETLWISDHSNQIGQEKVLLIIGVELKDLPEPGKTLCLSDVKVLAIVPGQKWKKEDVAREYERLADRIGAPRFLLCDGATELREPAQNLEKNGRMTVVLGDLKHHAANILEKEVGRSDRFTQFISQVGLTRNRVQQTELSQFTPPPLKQKSRFMNLGQLLRWSAMVLYHLGAPKSKARKGIKPERMIEKLGWIAEYYDDLKLWSACQELIDKALNFINHEGLSHGTSDRLWNYLSASLKASWSYYETFHRVFSRLFDFVQESEQKLAAGERAWLSTELLESLFGRFKRLEGQHSKGGFTSLLAAIPTLCGQLDAEKIRQSLKQVNTRRLKQWLESTIGRTLTSRRNAAYAEYEAAMI